MTNKRDGDLGAKSLYLNAIIIAAVVILLYFLRIILISNITSLALFSSQELVIDLIVIFIVEMIYNIIAYKDSFLTMAFYGAFFSSLFLATYSASPFSIIGIIEDLIALFFVLYIGFWISNRKRLLPFLQVIAIVLIVVIAFYFISKNQFSIVGLSGIISSISSYIKGFGSAGINSTTITNLQTNTTTVPRQNNNTGNLSVTNTTTIYTRSQNQTIEYMLGLINKDRSAYGLKNVSLSNITSAQQHAESMLENNYFSHWDIYGLKPYMRYTLLGGRGAVTENIAYKQEDVKRCDIAGCTISGDLNLSAALADMEYSMMYNDSACCNNGHRLNILDPNHNQVSIGIAYNGSTAYLVEDFINNYIDWKNQTPSYDNYQISLDGNLSQGYKISSIEISYDPTASNMTVSELENTSEYSYGNIIAGVSPNSYTYYNNITTIVAERYSTGQNDFAIRFNIQNLTQAYQGGEYTILIFMSSGNGSSFVGSTYTIFLNQNGIEYYPKEI